MIDEWGGTLTLTEASSRELMRVLKEQDDEFMDNLFNGKCGFTLTCTDGRSVELVPTADRKTEPMKTTDYCDICKRDMCEDCIADATNPYCVPSHYEINYEPKTEQTEPQTEYRRVGQAIDSVTGKVLGETYDVPQTDCSWKKGE